MMGDETRGDRGRIERLQDSVTLFSRILGSDAYKVLHNYRFLAFYNSPSFMFHLPPL